MIDIPESIIAQIRRHASYGVSTGRDHLPSEAAYYRRCTQLHPHTGTLIIFTRDTGHHSSGWFKSPDYERCVHVSLSFRIPKPDWGIERLLSVEFVRNFMGWVESAPFNSDLADQWVQAILGHDAAKLSWSEGAFTPEGKQLNVRHWRTFCDRSWQPIHPRGEVYNRDFTEKGWKSWSDLHPEPNWVSAE